MLLPIHIAAGGLAIVLGAVALSVKKGGTIHRRSGMLFVYAMVMMAVTASIIAIRSTGADGNVLASIVTIYFVTTALTAVRPPSAWANRVNAGATFVSVSLALVMGVSGVKNIQSSMPLAGGVPSRTVGIVSLFFALVLLLAAVGDIRYMRTGPARSGLRLSRHLWRMCFALFIAAGSFLSIRERVAKILPEPLTSGWMRLLPIVLLFGTMFYWLWKLRGRRRVTAPGGHLSSND